MDLKGKLALVTGSTSGIGLSIAHALAKIGCDIIVTGLGDDKTITDIVDTIKSEHKVNAEYIAADLRHVDEIKALTSQLLERHPAGVDILINNAGIDGVHAVEDCPDELWDAMLAVQLTAPFQLIKLLVPAMKKKGWGRIVNTSSILGFVSAARQSAYSATKCGLIGLTKGVALEVAESGITCNAVCPGIVMTKIADIAVLAGSHGRYEINVHVICITEDPGHSRLVYLSFVLDAVEMLAKIKNISVKEQEGEFLQTIPTRKFLTPDQVAEFVIFIVASSASDQMTGTAYLIDGGYTAQ